MDEGLSARLARHVAETRFEGLPAEAVQAAKLSLLDGLGVMLAASGLDEAASGFLDLGGVSGGPCALIGRGRRAGLLEATLANGALAHALDYEDALDGAPIHPNAAALPAVLALAQQRGGVSGRGLLTAIAVGCDVTARLGLSLTRNPDDYGWYPPPILGAQGAAAACASLLGVSARQVMNAFAFALGPGGQSAEFKRTSGSSLRAVRDGFAAHAGLVAALLADRGLSAFEAPLEGEAGLFALYARGAYDPSVLLRELGRRYYGAEVSFKPWPSCRGTHAAIEAAIELRDRASVETVQEIRVVGGPVQAMLGEPREIKCAPQTAIEAKFSLPFTIACALVRGQVTLEDFDTAALSDPAILQVADKVWFELGEGLGMGDATSATLQVRIANGQTFVRSVPIPRGHPSRPMSLEQMTDKFRDCAARAKAAPDADRLIETVLDLDGVEDLNAALFPLLS